jgi:predicted AlkP superfamily phosphohydrolase/phosphomutase
MASTRLLILGMDAAEPELLRAWSADGTLPNLAALGRRGLSAGIRGLPGFHIGSTWPSLYTGTTPARHGFHYQIQHRPGTYRYHRPQEHGLIHGTPFWRALSDADRRVAMLDVPLSPLDRSLNGVQIQEWGGHDALYGFHAHPASLAERIRTRFGDHPVGASCDGERRTAKDHAGFVDGLVRGVEAKAEMTREFLREGAWDAFMQVFSETHCVGHQCWHLHDPSHPAYDADMAAAVGDPVKRVYQAVDSAIGGILEEAGDCTAFVLSAHGMGYWYGADFLLPEILSRLGVSQPAVADEKRAGNRSTLRAGAAWGWHRLPAPMRARLRGIRDRYGPKPPAMRTPSMPPVDMAQSRCFHQPNGLATGGIRLNLAGREPQGTLEPGPEADAFVGALTQDLLDIVDERTGQPFIQRVIRVADHYQGPCLPDLPDLVVEYSDAVATGSTQVGHGEGARVRVHSPRTGVVEGSNGYGRTGEHRSLGLMFAAGPGVFGGEHAATVSILDLAPTWTRLLGVDLETAEGSPIDGIMPRS